MDPYALQQAPLLALITALIFFALAFVLLFPIWRFLNREEEVSRRWTNDEIARAHRHRHGGDGAPTEEPEPSDRP